MRKSVFSALESAEAAFGLAPFAFDYLLILLAHHPFALSTRGDPDPLDSCLLQHLGRGWQPGAAVVDRHPRGRFFSEHLAISLQGCRWHLSFVGSRCDAPPEQITAWQAIDEPLHPKLHFARTFGDRASCGDAAVNDLLGRNSPRLQPLLDLRD